MKPNLHNRKSLNHATSVGLALLLSTASALHAQDASPPTTNAAPAAEAPSADLIQKLLNRIEQLEKRDAERSQVINQLDAKVKSLESGRVLPEITVTPHDGPTTQELDQKIRVLERNNELATEAAEARAKEAPRLSVGQNGFVLSSADTNFVLKLKGLVQLDSRTFFDDNDRIEGNSSFLLRRVRPIFEGTLFRDFDFLFVPEFGGSSVQIQDAYLNYRYQPWLQLRGGKFKNPVGYEQNLSDSTLPFNERSLVTALVPNRSIGLQLWGDVADGVFSYAAGVFNASGDARNPNNNDFTDDKQFAGKIAFLPFKQSDNKYLKGFGFGLAGSYSQIATNALGLPNATGGTLSGYATDGQQQFFAYQPTTGTVLADGTHWRLSPHVTYLNGPFGLLAEYVISHQGVRNTATQKRDDLENTAWQVSAQWVLTGEPASFTGINPLRPFNLRTGGWGAWQLVARYGQLDIDNAAFQGFSNPNNSATLATSWSVGVNWWLNKNVRVLTSFSHTTFDGGGNFSPGDPSTFVPPATVTAQDENVLFTRLQLGF